jgi:predicted dienelactone hydrolase
MVVWALFLLSAATLSQAEGLQVSQIRLAATADAPELGVRVAYPTTGRRLAVVLFSHGAYSSKDLYNGILEYWAARGFVVLAPTHRDSVSLGVKRGNNDPRYFAWRLDDMARLHASLTELETRIPALAKRMDLTRIAATGHSFGGLVAQTLGGATYFDPVSGTAQSRALPNIKAVVIFSGAGIFPPLLRAEDFAGLKLPTLVTVGSNDLEQAPGLSGYQWRRQPFDLIGSRDKYLLILDGCDHYLGGSVGRDDRPLDARAAAWLREFNRVSADFLGHALNGKPNKIKLFTNANAKLERPLGAD